MWYVKSKWFDQFAAARANPSTRWGMIAAALVIGLPLLVLIVAAAVIGVAVFMTMVLIMRIVTLVRAGLGVLTIPMARDDGRRNVRVVQRD